MCTDLVISVTCPSCQKSLYRHTIYQRACEEADEAGRALNDFVFTYAQCTDGLQREMRNATADQPCGFCRWKTWVQSRQELMNVDFWDSRNRRGPGEVKVQTRAGWRMAR